MVFPGFGSYFAVGRLALVGGLIDEWLGTWEMDFGLYCCGCWISVLVHHRSATYGIDALCLGNLCSPSPPPSPIFSRIQHQAGRRRFMRTKGAKGWRIPWPRYLYVLASILSESGIGGFLSAHSVHTRTYFNREERDGWMGFCY